MIRFFAISLCLALVLTSSALYGEDAATGLLLKQAASLEVRGRLDLAAQNWKRVLMADPNQAGALEGLARVTKQSGRAEESAEYVERLRSLDARHPAIARLEALKDLARYKSRLEEVRTLVADEQYAQAMAIYREVFGAAPPAGAWAIGYYETEAATPGGWERAAAGLNKLSGQYPNVAEYRLSLGRIWTYRPATRDAGVGLLEAVRGDAVLVNKARLAWRQALMWGGANPASADSIRAFLHLYPDPELQEVLDEIGRLRAGRARRGGQEERLAYEALTDDRLREAERLFKEAIEAAPESSNSLAGLGFVYMKQQRFQSAIARFKSALQLAPDDQIIVDAAETARFWQLMQEAGKASDNEDTAKAADLYEQAAALRENNADAIKGLAGARMKQERAGAAVPLYQRLVRLQPENEQAWRELINAQYRAQGGATALATIRRLPEALANKLDDQIEYLVLLASVYSDTRRLAEFDKVFSRALDMAADSEQAAPLRMQLAGLLLRQGRAFEAATEFERAVDSNLNNVDAWEGLLAALAVTKNEIRAVTLLRRMPEGAYADALERPGFLRSAATIHRLGGRLSEAEQFLKLAMNAEGSDSPDKGVSTKLELALVWLEQGNGAAGERLLRKLLSDNSENPEVWKALLTVLHRSGRNDEAMSEALRIPATVSMRLLNDPDYISLLAGIHNARGEYDLGLRLVRSAIAALKAERKPAPPELEIQLGWLLLNSRRGERELYELLTRANLRTRLTPAQQQGYTELWSVWSRRAALAAADDGDYRRSVSILTGTLRLFPGDHQLYSALCGVLMQSGDARRALVVYKSWGLADAGAEDYAGAIGAAMVVRDSRLTTRWLRTALAKWPGNSQLLDLAGREAAQRGDYKKAEQYWRAALALIPAPGLASEGTLIGAASGRNRSARDQAAQELGALLLAGMAPQGSSDMGLEPLRAAFARTSASAYSPAPVGPARTGNFALPPSREASAPLADWTGSTSLAARSDMAAMLAAAPGNRDFAAPGAAPPRPPSAVAPAYDPLGYHPPPAPTVLGDSYPLAAAAPFAFPAPAFEADLEGIRPERPRSQRDEIEDQIAALESRNSPFLGSNARISSRNGRSGLEKLTVQEADLEASMTLGNRIRLSVIARPVYLDAGEIESNSPLRLGLAPRGAASGQQTQSGLGAEIQLSGENFGLSAGSTPDGFLVRNATFGLRFHPSGTPFTVMFERDSVRETMLSYAGARDPVSKRIWGGVMANNFSVQADWGDEESGFYTRVGYQSMTGKHVADNKGLNAGAGGYWRALTLPEGSLNIGFNLYAMGYDKNLRYFTLGHGGYFSPQRYFLFNVPVTWRGTWEQRLEYSLSASLGSQYVREEAAPFFPIDAALQGRSGPFYSALTHTGAHYNLDMKADYRLAPHWALGGFLSVNNARNFTSQAAGVSLRYLFRPRPLQRGVNIPSLPDWRGRRPFGLP